MSAELIVTAYDPANLGNKVTTFARLLTEDLRKLFERQNIDCADINCMKWPLFGASRHATCKVLLTKTDLRNLVTLGNPGTWDYGSNTNSAILYQIWFYVPGTAEDMTPTYFTRMSIADVQPLCVSAFGHPYHGEALYIVTFKCPRWALRSHRFVRPNGESWSDQGVPDWDRSRLCGDVGYAGANLTPRTLFQEILTDNGNLYGFDLNTSTYLMNFPPDQFVEDSTIASRSPYATSQALYSGSFTHDPFLSIMDEVAFNCGAALACVPSSDVVLPGQYTWVAKDIRGNNMARALGFLQTHQHDVIAGAIHGTPTIADLSSYGDLVRKFLIPNEATRMIGGAGARVMRRFNPEPNGTPPAVFAATANTNSIAAPSGTGRFDTPHLCPVNRMADMWDWFNTGTPPNANDPQHNRGFGTSWIDCDEGGFRRADPSLSTNQRECAVDASSTATDLHGRINERYQYATGLGVCDIWFRGWIMPGYEDCWIGGNWIELRLQTDGKGFGFPTTRIYGSFDDPMILPKLSEESPIKGLGLAQSWMGADGRPRVNVEWSFGIPCLIRITGNTRITAGVDAWRYTARIAHKFRDDASAPAAAKEHFGGIDSWVGANEQDAAGEIIAYNLAEVANTSTFSSGYKKPLPQTGFSVLPIGQDRDNTLRPVVVQAMLYRGGPNNPRTCAYFCLSNAVDGDCA